MDSDALKRLNDKPLAYRRCRTSELQNGTNSPGGVHLAPDPPFVTSIFVAKRTVHKEGSKICSAGSVAAGI